MHYAEIGLLLLLILCVVTTLARRFEFSYPIAFVLAGMAIAWLSDVPVPRIPPELVLFIFLPPLLTESAYFTSIRDFRANMRPILQLALGLVCMSCLTVAWVAYTLIPGLPLAAAFVLGAIVSPPDAVAAASVIERLKVPKRIATILAGESLINDATGLVLYKFAVAAMVMGTFSWSDATLNFAWIAASGIAVGWLCGRVYVLIFPYIQECSVEILSSLLVPYAAYMLAEFFAGSGVLAVVASGMTVGWHAPRIFYPALRLPIETVWRMGVYILNGLVFLLIGLQFPSLFRSIQGYGGAALCFYAVAIALTAILTRFAWVYLVAYGTRFLFPTVRAKDAYPPWQNVFIIAWTGMRGVVSLALALAIPLTLADGAPFPERDLVIFLAFTVIIATLILQGIPLPWLVRKLSLNYDGKILYEDWNARREAAIAALEMLKQIGSADDQRTAIERIQSHYNDRIASLGEGPNTPLGANSESLEAETHPLIQAEHRAWHAALEAERKTVIRMRETFEISDDVMNDLLRDIDLMHSRFARVA